MQEGFGKLQDLTDADFAAIKQLADVCYQHDSVQVKLNWDIMHHRAPGQVSDFGFYHDDQLVGFIPLDGFGDQFEITGIVHPDFRRRGIFRQLMAEARAEAIRRGAKSLLLVNYKRSKSGTDMAQALGLPYDFSEYHMRADFDSETPTPDSPLQLVEVTESDLLELSRLLGFAFGEGGWSAIEELRDQFQRKDGQYWIARLGAESIGQIGAIDDTDHVYIRGVGIVPDHRSKGYGRQLLTLLIHQLSREGHRRFELDVEVRNNNALTLYESCGFHETNVYDYYTIAL